MYQYFYELLKLEDRQNHHYDIHPAAIQYYYWGIPSHLILIKDTMITSFKHRAWLQIAVQLQTGPAGSHGEPRQLRALHLL